jgi:predicted transcriptional regulator
MKTKSKEEIVSVRLKGGVSKRLEALAEATDRSRSFLAAEAIEQYLELQEWQIQAVQVGLAQAEAGQFATPAQVKAAFKRAKAN